MMYSGNGIFWFVCVFLCVFIISSGNASDPCLPLTTCGECIRVLNCVWCSKVSTSKNGTNRCQLRDRMESCPSESLIDPVPIYKVIEDNPLTRSNRKSEPIQLHPQRASLTNLRHGLVYNISLQYKVVKDYPADLYYLMDVSQSMFYDKENLVRLTESLVESMRNLTKEFKIGFGSFVDKNVLPFVERITESCGGPPIGCAITYSFQHKLSMTDDVTKFAETANSTKIVWTYDEPEGGFDALLQAMVCHDQIGWSPRSRRLIVFVTDAHAHLAGNGRLGGIVKPNDGFCHLDPNDNTYREPLNQDYPSLGQISHLAKKNDINLIFAVTDKVAPSYREFQKVISGSSVGILSSDSENIVNLIRDSYKNISTSVEMTDTAGASVRVRYYTACKGTLVQENRKCDHLEIGDVVNFNVSIEAIECPTNISARNQIIQFQPVGVNEVFTLHLEIVCDCPCEKPGNPGFIANAPECNSVGNLKCGVCECDSSHIGNNCECSANVNMADMDSQCKQDNTTDVLCNNRGECLCGTCNCQERPNPLEVISGKYCECDNFSCDRTDGILCSGQGECKCGQCLCNDGWMGNACDCMTTDDSCMPIGGGDVCSGNGVCKCGSCVCSGNSQGQYCQDCPTCPSRCDDFTPCVQCTVFKTGPYMANNEEACKRECTYRITVEETVKVEESSERDCSYENEQKCTVKFVYGYDSNGARQVRVQQDPVCPDPVPVLAIGLGLLGAIVLVGLALLLLYRIFTYVYDKREYARFLNEKENAKWSRENNPLYVDPTRTFKNPAYNS
ncbi:integrin beta-PS-like [Daphnia pulex]|uniref:integrin beta-PS-like n=1 Tax=Daphnia pulex TaxID=6669 RepID=UPI001EDF128B|nr:integrin beta-PS-like [Daphnia pulex]